MLRAFQFRDFRLLWGGAFLSFVGSWIQAVAEGYLVFEMTHDEFKLAFVSFVATVPIFLLSPIAGTVADMFHKRTLLVLAQVIFACGALYLAAATYFGFVQYWQILVVAVVLGTVATLEMPVRQSVVSRVVPPEELQAAIPLNALTFNLARLIGPAIGGFILAKVGVAACYLINGLSFIAIIVSALAIKANLSAHKQEPQPILDLIVEGVLYTVREVRLLTLLLLEVSISFFGLFYLSQVPAIVQKVLGISPNQIDTPYYKQALSLCYLFAGVGSVTALLVVTYFNQKPIKAFLIKISITLFAIALYLLANAKHIGAAYFAVALLGMSGVTMFNTANTLFQLLAPEKLRGRVLSMHVWALSGIGPFGVLLFGWLAAQTSLPFALQIGATCVLISALVAWTYRKGTAGYP